MTSISPHDTYVWQRRTVAALAAMLEHGHTAALPSLSWTVADHTGALVGEATGLTSTPEQQRDAFDAWADYLGATRSPERMDGDGVTYLNAHFKWHKDDRVGGAIRADIVPQE